MGVGVVIEFVFWVGESNCFFFFGFGKEIYVFLVMRVFSKGGFCFWERFELGKSFKCRRVR